MAGFPETCLHNSNSLLQFPGLTTKYQTPRIHLQDLHPYEETELHIIGCFPLGFLRFF